MNKKFNQIAESHVVYNNNDSPSNGTPNKNVPEYQALRWTECIKISYHRDLT